MKLKQRQELIAAEEARRKQYVENLLSPYLDELEHNCVSYGESFDREKAKEILKRLREKIQEDSTPTC